MPKIRRSVEIEAPSSAAYEEWERFESLPTFLRTVRAVERIDERRSHWRIDILGREEEWIAETTERIPGRLLVWRGQSGPMKGGSISFEPLGNKKVRVTLQLEYVPNGVAASVADWFGVVSGRVEADLHRFKAHVENGGVHAPVPPREALVGQ